jgi:hypothetical protein
MKYIITETTLNRLIEKYLDSRKIRVEEDDSEIIVDEVGENYSGMFYYDKSEDELAIDPSLITMLEVLFNISRYYASGKISEWFEQRFGITHEISSIREWDW